jgi:large repetitive protein
MKNQIKLLSALMLFVTTSVFAQIPAGTFPVNMASVGTYTQDFSTVDSWFWNTNPKTSTASNVDPWLGFLASTSSATAGISVFPAANSIPLPLTTTIASLTFSTNTTTGGMQRSSATGNPATSLVMLATGSNTPNPSVPNNATACDLYLDFTGRNAGTLSLDIAGVVNNNSNSSPRIAFFKVFATTDGVVWTELTDARATAMNGSTGAGFNLAATISTPANPTFVNGFISLSNIALPSSFNNSSTARLRFYVHNGQDINAGAGGNRPKFAIDNISISSTAASSCANPITLNVSASTNNLCLGQTASLTATSSDPSATYTWASSTSSSVSGLAAGNTSLNATVAPTATTIYTISAVNGGCFATSTVAVTVNAIPTLSVSPVSSTVCAGGTESLTATSNATNFMWMPATDLNTNTGASVVSTPTASIVYTVTATSAAACTTTATVSINYISSVNVTISSNTTNTINCVGQSINLTASGANAYTWDPAIGLSSASSASVIASPSATTIYTITGSAGTCSGTATYEVVANNNPLPIISFGAANTDTTCVATAYSITASGADTYMWMPSTTLNMNTGAMVAATPTINTVYTVTGTSSFGCTSTATFGLSLYSKTNVVAAPNHVASCPGNDVLLQASGAATYVWSNGSTGASALMSPAAVGVYTVTGTDVNGCTGTSTTSVNILANNAIAHYSFQTLPSGLVDSIAQCGPYMATAGNPTVGNQTTVPASQFTVGVGANSQALYYGQTASSTAGNVNLGAVAKVTLMDPTATYFEFVLAPNAGYALALNSIQLANRSTSTGPQMLNIRSSVDNFAANIATEPVLNDGNWYVENINLNSVTNNQSAPITLRIYGSNGSGTQSGNINWRLDDIKIVTTAISLCTTPTVVASANPAIICAGSISSITASGATTYSWSDSTGVIATTAGLSVLPSTTAVYTVTGSNGVGCSATTTVSVVVNPLPMVNVIGINNACAGSTFSLTASGATSYSWVPTSPNGPASSSATFSEVLTTSDVYTVIGSDANGCAGTTSISIIANQLPMITTTGNDTICPGTSTTITATGGIAYLWNNLGTLNSITVTPSVQTTYTVIGTDSNGCTASSTATIFIAAPITGPTTTITKCFNAMPVIIGTNTFTTAGTYSVTFTNPGACDSIAVFDIIVDNSLPVINSVITTQSSCIGDGSVTINATGGNLSYSLNGTIGAINLFNNLLAGSYTVSVAEPSGCSATSIANVAGAPAMSFVAPVIVNTTACSPNVGSISAMANGGTGTKTYAILPIGNPGVSGTFNGLAAGSYTIIATDVNNCTATVSYSITQSAPVALTTNSVTAVSCTNASNGALSVSASGGKMPYTYAITPSAVATSAGNFASMPAGAYTVTVTDANNCTATTTDTISMPMPITLNFINMAPSCNGNTNGSIQAIAMGGTGTYTYTLVNPATSNTFGMFLNLGSSIYQVKATDANGCTKTGVVVLAQPAVLKFKSIARTNPTCNGASTGIISAVTTGGSGLRTLSIMPMNTVSVNTISGLMAGVYTLTVTDANSCTKTTTTTLTQPTAITFSTVLTTSTSNSLANGSIIVAAIGGVGVKQYTHNAAPNFTTSGTFTGLASGAYTITARDANNCSVTTLTTIAAGASIPNIGSVELVKNAFVEKCVVYPNPVSNTLNITYPLSKKAIQLSIYDAIGKCVRTEQVSNSLDVSALRNGMYLLRINYTDNSTEQLIFSKH